MLNNLQQAPISGIATVDCAPFRDARGQFARLFCSDALAPVWEDRPIVQINHSVTHAKGALRGLHFQRAPTAEAKLVRCLRGRVFDVAVDLRRDSPTFLQHFSVELSAETMNVIAIPEGCAHGFQTLESDCELLYLHSAPYTPASEGGLRWDDPALGIAWPLPVSDMSDRDREHPLFTAGFEGLRV